MKMPIPIHFPPVFVRESRSEDLIGDGVHSSGLKLRLVEPDGFNVDLHMSLLVY